MSPCRPTLAVFLAALCGACGRVGYDPQAVAALEAGQGVDASAPVDAPTDASNDSSADARDGQDPSALDATSDASVDGPPDAAPVSPDGPSDASPADTAGPADARDATAEAAPPRPCEVLYVTDGAVLQRFRSWLEGRSCRITAVEQENVTVGHAAGKTLVFLPEQIDPGFERQIGDRFKDVTIGVFSMERTTAAGLGMITLANIGSTMPETELEIRREGHPLAAGLRGTVTIFSGPATVGWSSAPAGATVVGTVPGSSSQVALLGYDQNDMMAGGVRAPGRRVHWYVEVRDVQSLNDNGRRLFEAAVDWAIGRL
jgi:hypothetical protein